MKKYLIYSIVLAVILFVGSLITLMIYEVTKLPDSLNRIITEVEEFTNHEFQLDFNKKFTSNLTYDTGLDGQSIYESQYFWQGIQLDIEVDLVNADVTVQKTDGDHIEVAIETKVPERYRIDFDGRELQIKEKKQVRFWLFGWNNYQKAQVVIKVPTVSVDVNLETINGDVMIELSGIDLAASTVNGDVTISHSAFTQANLSVVNGEIFVTDSNVSNVLCLQTVNGSLDVERVKADRFIAETVKGDFLLSDISGRGLSTSTVNGDFSGYNIYLSEIAVDKLNGSFKLVNEDSTYQIQSLKLSGLQKNHEIQANILNISYN